MFMPRIVAEILDQTDELAARFEAHEPEPTAERDAAALRTVREAFQARADAERRLADACRSHAPKASRGPRSAPWRERRVKQPGNATDAPSPSIEHACLRVESTAPDIRALN